MTTSSHNLGKMSKEDDQRVASGPGATQLLRTVLAEGRISNDEFNILTTQPIDAIEVFTPHDHIVGQVNACGICARKQVEAISKVLNTPELLEMILLYLPPSDLLLRLEKVCTAFRSAINSSKPLLRKIFVEPDYRSSKSAPLPFLLHRRKLIQIGEHPEVVFILEVESKTGRKPFPLPCSDSLRDRLVFQPPQKNAVVNIGSSLSQKRP